MYLMTKQDKVILLKLAIFTVIVSLLEVIGISAIMPFISVATNFKLIHTNDYYLMCYNFFNINNNIDFIITFGLCLILFYLLRTIINIVYTYYLNKFTQIKYYNFSTNLFIKYLSLFYKDFIKKNSSSMNKSIVFESSNLSNLIASVLFLLSELFIFILIYLILLYVDYKLTFFLTIFLLAGVSLIVIFVSPKIKKAGKDSEKAQKRYYELVNRNLNNYKMIKLHGNSLIQIEHFKKESLANSKANILCKTLSQVPKFFLEAFGFIILIIMIIYLVYTNKTDISSFLSLISLFVLSLYRLLPSVHKVIQNYNLILFYHRSLEIIYDEISLKNENLENETVFFKKDIIIDNMDFSHSKDNILFKNLNFKIKKGSKIAFIGESGSGKSTLVDILIGLHIPLSGKVLIDDIEINSNNIKSWRSKIGYIPQSIYLFDGTVAENIAFDSKINKNRIDKCLKQAKLYDFLKEKEGQNTFVGEGGVFLSGGQKQRIAIARALYSNPEVLVLDEATSALDDETEKEIMDEIYKISEQKTLIIIAHRLTTLSGCDIIYKIKDGKIHEYTETN
jgi:ATP-binding cassette subfamily B protein